METFLNDIAQQGIAFGLMGIIIYVLANRVKKLEEQKDKWIADAREEQKEIILLIRDATEAMKLMTKINDNEV